MVYKLSPRILAAIALACGIASPLHAEDFDWRNLAGANFLTPVKSQGSAGTCSGFSSTAVMEAWYKLTRNDNTQDIDLSEQQLVSDGIISVSGGWPSAAFRYDVKVGQVIESQLPYTASSYSSNWPLPAGWQRSTVISDSQTYNGFNVVTHDRLKAVLKQYGPVSVTMSASSEFYWLDGTTMSPQPSINHAVVLVGFHDDPTGPNGGYWIIKNSWGSGWGYSGYGYIQYGILEAHNYYAAITGPTYYTGSTGTATWKGGAGNWNETAANLAWTRNGVNSAWRDGEETAVFNTPGGDLTLAWNTSAHGLVFNPGATGYTLQHGALIVTSGGIQSSENVNFWSPVTVGAPQAWNVSPGKTLTFQTTLDTHISPLTIGGGGNVQVLGSLKDVRANPSFNGLLDGQAGSVTVIGGSTLQLAGASGNVNITGFIAAGGGIILLDNSSVNNNNRLPDNLNIHLQAGGELAIKGHSNGTQETTGTINVNAEGVITLDSGSPAHLPLLVTANALQRNSRGTLLVRGDLPVPGAPNQIGKLLFTTAPTLSGSGTGVTTGILPFAYGISTHSVNPAHNQSLMTYDAANGIRPLQSTESTATWTTGANMRLTSSHSLANASESANSLVLASDTNAVQLSLAANTTLTVNASAVLSAGNLANTITGGKITAGSNAVSSNELIVFTPADLTLASSVVNNGGAVSLTKSGAGKLTLSAANTYTGDLSINDGSVHITSVNTPENAYFRGDSQTTLAGAGSVQTSRGAVLGQHVGDAPVLTVRDASQFRIADTLHVANSDNSQATLALQNSGVISAKTFNLGNSAGSVGTLNQSGGTLQNAASPGEWRIGGVAENKDATARGIYNLSGGSANLSADLCVGAYGVGELNQTGGSFTSSGWISVGRYGTGVGTVDLSAGAFNQTGTGTHLIIGQNGIGTLNIRGTAAVTLASNLWVGMSDASMPGAGTVNLDGGTLTTPGIEHSGSTSRMNFGGGVLRASASSASFMNGLSSVKVKNGGAIIDSNGFNITVASSLAADAGSTGGLQKRGAGKLTLTNANTYAGDTLIQGGTLSLGTTGVASTVSVVNPSFESPSVAGGDNWRGVSTAESGWNWTAGGIGYGNNAWFNGAAAGNQAAFMWHAGTISQSLNFTAPGEYLVQFYVTKRFGNYTADHIDVQLDGANVTGGHVDYSAQNETWTKYVVPVNIAAAGTHAIGFNFTMPSGVGTDWGSNLDNVLVGKGSSAAIPAASGVAISSNAALELNNNIVVIGSLAGETRSTVSLGSGRLTLGGNNRTTTFSGNITGSGAVVKTGAGTLTLDQGNSFTGGFTLQSGGLRVANTTGSATGAGEVQLLGGILSSGAQGAITGPVTANTGAVTLAPGGLGGIGALDLGSIFTLAGNTTLDFDINAGLCDFLDIDGLLNITAGKPTIALHGSGWITGRTYQLMDYAFNAGLSLSSFNLPGLPSGWAWSVTPTALAVAYIPEPTSIALLGLGILILPRRRA